MTESGVEPSLIKFGRDTQSPAALGKADYQEIGAIVIAVGMITDSLPAPKSPGELDPIGRSGRRGRREWQAADGDQDEDAGRRQDMLEQDQRHLQLMPHRQMTRIADDDEPAPVRSGPFSTFKEIA